MKTKIKILLSVLTVVGALCLTLNTLEAQNPPAVPGSPVTGVSKGKEHHPALHRAIAELEAAKKHLEHADHDFGGHRKQALIDCEKAIAQLKLALQFDKK